MSDSERDSNDSPSEDHQNATQRHCLYSATQLLRNHTNRSHCERNRVSFTRRAPEIMNQLASAVFRERMQLLLRWRFSEKVLDDETAIFVINRTVVDDVLPSLNSSSIVSSLKQYAEDFVRPCADPGSLSQSGSKALIPTKKGDPAMAARYRGKNLLTGSWTTLLQSACCDDSP